ncbi:MAG: extracellular solute-binding protein [Clostridia bacterium]|nr:extracellular solute-binding protein [Clostridia bacterium]
MKKLSKVISSLAALALLASAFVGCGQQGQTRVETDGSSFTYWVNMDGNTKNAGLQNNSEMMLYKEMEKNTGIHIDFIHPAEGTTGNEAATTMFLDEKLPDIIKYSWDAYPGGPQQAIDDGVIIALNKELDLSKAAPEYWNYVKDGEMKKAVTTDSGDYYGFNNLNLGETKGFAGLYVRRDKLKEWNMDVPTNIDEWTALFAKAKESGFSKPFTAAISDLTFSSGGSSGFNTAYDVGRGFYIDDVDGKAEVVFAPLQEGFSEYLAQLAAWYKAGYIDPDFATVASDVIMSNMVNDISVASHGYIGSAIGKILPAALDRNPNFDLVACPYPTTADGHESEFQVCYNPATSTANAISWQCGNYEKAAEWCNYVYTEEGMVLQLFGIEGEHHTVEMRDDDGDGVEEKHYVYTDLIAEPKNSNCNSVAEAMYKYMLPCNYPGYNQHIDYLMGYYQYDQQKEAIVTWNVPANKDGTEADDPNATDTPQEHQLPTLSYTNEESSRVLELTTLVEADLGAVFIDVVMGHKSLSDWEAAVDKAMKDGYEEILEIRNAAFDRYQKK